MDEFQKTYQKAVQFWFNDGIFEILLGGILLLLALYFSAIELFPQKSALDGLFEASFILFVFAGAYGLNKLARFLKERITIPRGGLIVFKSRKKLPRGLVALLGAVIGGSLGVISTVFFSDSGDFTRWLPAISGGLLSIVFFFIAVRTNLGRIFTEAAIALGAGILVSGLGIRGNSGLIIFYGGLGLTILAIAGITLLKFLRQYLLPREEDHDA